MKGEVIAFIGAPGVGTSFLIKQMACRYCRPCFLEGEEGIFTQSVLDVINNKEDSPERYNWLTNRIKLILEQAHTIANTGITSYVDGDILLVEAWFKAEIGNQSPLVLKKWLEINNHLMADKVIILTASDKKLKENIISRGRLSEQSDFIKKRAIRIGQECVKLENKYKHIKLLDRSSLDFTEVQTLDLVDNLIKDILSRKKR